MRRAPGGSRRIIGHPTRGHRLQETADKAKHEQIAVKVVHAGEEMTQKVLDRADEVARKGRHHGQERADKAKADARSPKGG